MGVDYDKTRTSSLPDDEERMLRKLVQLDRSRKQHGSGYIFKASRNDPEGTLIRHLDQAGMISVLYRQLDIIVAEVLMHGYEHMSNKDTEIKNEAQRIRELKQSRRHDWAIAIVPSAIKSIAPIVGTVIGTVVGYMLGSS